MAAPARSLAAAVLSTRAGPPMGWPFSRWRASPGRAEAAPPGAAGQALWSASVRAAGARAPPEAPRSAGSAAAAAAARAGLAEAPAASAAAAALSRAARPCAGERTNTGLATYTGCSGGPCASRAGLPALPARSQSSSAIDPLEQPLERARRPRRGRVRAGSPSRSPRRSAASRVLRSCRAPRSSRARAASSARSSCRARAGSCFYVRGRGLVSSRACCGSACARRNVPEQRLLLWLGACKHGRALCKKSHAPPGARRKLRAWQPGLQSCQQGWPPAAS